MGRRPAGRCDQLRPRYHRGKEMTKKAIEAGTRAILEVDPFAAPNAEQYASEASKACIEAAIASGEVVPASAELSGNSGELRDRVAEAIRGDGSDLCDAPWITL